MSRLQRFGIAAGSRGVAPGCCIPHLWCWIKTLHVKALPKGWEIRLWDLSLLRNEDPRALITSDPITLVAYRMHSYPAQPLRCASRHTYGALRPGELPTLIHIAPNAFPM